MDFIDRLEERAQRLGFDFLGVAAPWPSEDHVRAYRDWLARGDHAGMGYMARPDRVARREAPDLILPGVRSAVCVAVNYYPGPMPPPPDDRLRGYVSNYAWGQNYHDWILPRLEELADFIDDQIADDVGSRAYVDTGPLLERALATQAGLGFMGKNTCLIHPRRGSWLFLGQVLVDVELPATGEVVPPRCGTCTRCLDTCPTGALRSPYRLDARRCISYLTIEHKGSIPRDLRPLLGRHIYGCDICQEVCPWQRFARPTGEPAFQVGAPERTAPALLDLMELDEEGFRRRFRDTVVLRLGRARMARNAAVALGNVGDGRAVPTLERALMTDPAPLVRGHAAWALGRIGSPGAARALASARERERDVDVRQEIVQALEDVEGE